MANIKHPRLRLAARADFPSVQTFARNADAMFDVFERECMKHAGRIPSQIVVAWPHKNVIDFPNRPDDSYVQKFLKLARARYPKTQFFLADGLFEKRKLDRALDTADTRYNKRQQWALSKKFQTQTLPPLNGANVVILDDTSETGATFADFVSMLNYNGAHVLMSAVPSQKKEVFIQFRQTPEEDGRIAALDTDFRDSAKRADINLDPGEATHLVERALNKKGYSLRTLTPGEFQELRDEFDPNHQPVNFAVFLDEIGGKLPARFNLPKPSGLKPG